MDHEDILNDERGASVRLAINRPDAMNAFRGRTVDELLHFRRHA